MTKISSQVLIITNPTLTGWLQRAGLVKYYCTHLPNEIPAVLVSVSSKNPCYRSSKSRALYPSDRFRSDLIVIMITALIGAYSC